MNNLKGVMLLRQNKWLAALVAAAGLIVAPDAQAGMVVYGLRDVYRLRFEEISFLILLLFLSALLLKLLWNYAAKGFSFLPRLKYLQALSAALLMGLVMLVILTMISGIREVLTPDAWRRQGSSYRLNDPSQEPSRRRSLEHLRGALLQYASAHAGRFPMHDFGADIPEKLWEAPDQAGSHYIYIGGLTTNNSTALLAVEPLNFGGMRFVMRTSGDIEQLPSAEIERLLVSKPAP